MGRAARIVTTIIAAGILFATSVAVAQQQPKPRVPAPIRPYKPVATALPASISDPSFEEFRRQLGEIAVRKDSAGLARMIVAQGFFWKGEKGERADKNKSGVENLGAAVNLNAPDGAGWDQLMAYAFDPTAAPVPSVKDVVCSPADPVFNDQEFENLLKATQTDLEEWGYPLVTGIEVRAGKHPNAPVIEKLGLHFVRVLLDEAPSSPTELPTLRVATPAGKTGYIPAFALAPLGNDQLCYRKEADGWKIAGYIGGDP